MILEEHYRDEPKNILFLRHAIRNLKLYLFVSFSIICLIQPVLSFSFAENMNTLALATGSEKGVYYAIGQGIEEVAKKSNIEINAISSQGSVENLYWLSNGKVELCIAQSDTVYNAYNGLGKFKEKITNIQAIASLYTEAVHILIRNPLLIKKIEDFKGKRISVGPEGSGTESNALAVLEAAGITTNEIQLLHLSFDDSIIAINEGKADIVFFTSGYPSDAVKIIIQNKNAYFFEPKPDILQRLIDFYPFFVITTIPAGTYPYQDEDITTIGVPALLVSRSDLDDQVAYLLTKMIFSNVSLIAKYHKKAFDIKLKSAFKGITVPIKAGANQFYTEKGLYRKEIYKKIATHVLEALLILCLAIAIIKFKKIKFFFKKREIVQLLVVLSLLWILGSIVLYYSEHKINENYSNLFLAFWSSLINWINFGGKEPYTLVGRATATIMMVLGIGGIAWLTGTIASIYVHKKLIGGRRMIDKLKNHYVIINWNEMGEGIIAQLRKPDIEKKPIIVVTDSKESPLTLKYEYEDVYHIYNDTIDEMVLKKARVHLAHSVIVLAKRYGYKDIDSMTSTSDVSDAATVLIILAIREICAEQGKQVHIVAEILNPQKVKLADFVGGWGDGSIEIVSPRYLEQNLLSQVAVTPGLTEIYNDLLTFGTESNEIYMRKIPSKFVGKSIVEFFKFIISLRDKNINIIPFAISRKGKIYINPSISEINFVEDGDILYAVCDKESDLKRLDDFRDSVT